MPSFRVVFAVGALNPGVLPPEVLPAAAAAAAELTTMEANSIAIVRGAAQLTVRFTADDAEIAQQVARHVVATAAALAEVPSWTLRIRRGSTWLPIHTG